MRAEGLATMSREEQVGLQSGQLIDASSCLDSLLLERPRPFTDVENQEVGTWATPSDKRAPHRRRRVIAAMPCGWVKLRDICSALGTSGLFRVHLQH